MLQIGARASGIGDLLAEGTELPAGSFLGRRTVLVLLPAASVDAVEAAVERYRQNTDAFREQAAELIVGIGREEGELPAVILIDENGTVRHVYDAVRYPGLPNPTAVLRALRKLDDAQRPAPVADDDWQAGPPDASVVLIEYSDYECRHCIDLHFALQSLPVEILSCVLRVHRHLPLRTMHPHAQLAAEAAEAAGAQGRFWEMHQRLFEARGDVVEPALLRYAAEIGLDVARFGDELGRRVHEGAVNEDLRRAVSGRIKLPPSLFINGVLYEGDRSVAGLAATLTALIE